MRKLSLFGAFCALSVSAFASAADDGRIENLAATTSGSEKDITFTWSAFNNINDLENVEGYGIMWKGSPSDLNATGYAKQRVPKNTTELTIRGDDWRGDTYYVTVFTYHEVNGDVYMMNGAKPLKVEVAADGDITTTTIERTIPDDSPKLVSEDGTTIPEVDFGQMIGSGLYPDQIIFSWPTKRELGKNSYDKMFFKVSKNSDMSDPIHTFEPKVGIRSVKIKGLDASTKYYVQGMYKKDDVSFGKSDVFTFETRAAYTKDEAQKRVILLANNLLREDAGMETSVSGTSSSSSSTTKSTTSVGSSSSNFQNAKELRARIAELKQELWQLERKLQNIEKNTTPTSLTNVPRGRSITKIRKNLPLITGPAYSL